jgi:uncharacterized protein (DUF2384 family)
MNKQKSSKRKDVNRGKDKIDGLEVSAAAGRIWNDRIIEEIRRNKQRENEVRKRALALYEIMDIGPKALGGKNKLFAWLISPNMALGGKIPLKLMIDDQAELVSDELIRIEHGVFV